MADDGGGSAASGRESDEDRSYSAPPSGSESSAPCSPSGLAERPPEDAERGGDASPCGSAPPGPIEELELCGGGAPEDEESPGPADEQSPGPAEERGPQGSEGVPNDSPRSGVDRASCELAALVRPGGGAGPAVPEEIWRCVQEGARLPGRWDETVEGALDAMRNGDAALCTYLAARCYYCAADRGEAGANALAAKDERCARTLWLKVATPIVLEVPPGHERLCVRFEGAEDAEWVPTSHFHSAVSDAGAVFVHGVGRGHGALALGPGASAECLCAGAALDITTLRCKRRLLLEDEDTLALRQALVSGASAPVPQCLRIKSPPTAHVTGVWFSVIAYPLAGDFTKALLRPASRMWSSSQWDAAERAVRLLGETLVSQCAKASRWDLVALLLSKGVPCPDLGREFEEVCGAYAAVRRQWRRDLAAARAAPSLLELATFARAAVLPRVLEALRAAGGPVVVRGDPGGRRPPPIVLAAGARRWDIVESLLRQPEDVDVGAAEFLASPEALPAPAAVLRLAEARRGAEEDLASRPTSLREYFRQRHRGEVVGPELLPRGFKVEDRAIAGPGECKVADIVLQMEGCAAASLASGAADVFFLEASPAELAEVAAAVADAACAVVPLDLGGRLAAGSDEELLRAPAWAPVLCPTAFVDVEDPERPRLLVPANRISAPRLVRGAKARVRVVSPCCCEPLADVRICVDRRQVGVTNASGVLRFELPLGRHIITAPSVSSAEQAVQVGSSASRQDIRLSADGALVLFLQDNSNDDVVKDGVMLCANTDDNDVRPFFGRATFPDGRAALSDRLGPGSGSIVGCVASGRPCHATLNGMAAKSADGRKFTPNDDLQNFVEEAGDHCAWAMLFTATPIRLGDFLGPPPSAAPAMAQPAQPALWPSVPAVGASPVSAVSVRVGAKVARPCAAPAPGPAPVAPRPRSVSAAARRPWRDGGYGPSPERGWSVQRLRVGPAPDRARRLRRDCTPPPPRCGGAAVSSSQRLRLGGAGGVVGARFAAPAAAWAQRA